MPLNKIQKKVRFFIHNTRHNTEEENSTLHDQANHVVAQYYPTLCRDEISVQEYESYWITQREQHNHSKRLKALVQTFREMNVDHISATLDCSIEVAYQVAFDVTKHVNETQSVPEQHLRQLGNEDKCIDPTVIGKLLRQWVILAEECRGLEKYISFVRKPHLHTDNVSFHSRNSLQLRSPQSIVPARAMAIINSIADEHTAKTELHQHQQHQHLNKYVSVPMYRRLVLQQLNQRHSNIDVAEEVAMMAARLSLASRLHARMMGEADSNI
jgi:hypothetical protein